MVPESIELLTGHGTPPDAKEFHARLRDAAGMGIKHLEGGMLNKRSAGTGL